MLNQYVREYPTIREESMLPCFEGDYVRCRQLARAGYLEEVRALQRNHLAFRATPEGIAHYHRHALGLSVL